MTDIAKKAGVSQATVSRVVNRDPKVAAGTVAAVKRAMRELGYTPQPRRKRTRHVNHGKVSGQGTIALVMLDNSMDTHPFMSLTKLRGVEAAVGEAGMTLALARLPEGGGLPPALLLPDLRGVLLWGHGLPPEIEQVIDEVPHYWLSSHAEAGANVVLVGNEQAGRLAADYLLENGVEHPAALHPSSPDARYELRVQGLRIACLARNREVAMIAADLPRGTFFAELPRIEQRMVVRELVGKLVASEPRPDGLFLPDDILTPQVYLELRRHDIAPEKDIRIVSCGNEAAYLNALDPRPATIDLGPGATGRLAVEQLLREIASPGSANGQISMMVNPRLVEGEAAEDA
ncbi:MAG: LacI family DNA-binding transcriptional regulator [Verrucomicrobiota bacterium]